MEILKGKSIEDALSKEYRQYLAGRLKKEQPFLKHIDDDIEIGISNYVTFTADKPHMHTQCTEHNYVLRGKMKVKLLDGSCEEYEFSEGDLFVLRPGTPYAYSIRHRPDDGQGQSFPPLQRIPRRSAPLRRQTHRSR